MGSDKTYSERAIEVAEFFFANPMAKRKDILAIFGKKWQIPNRTLDRIWKEAKEYNKTRTQALEKVKDDVLVSKTKETIEKGIDYREECFAAVYRVLRGVARKAEDDLLIPTDSDILRAASWFADIYGWRATLNKHTNIKRMELNIEVADEDAVKTIENIKDELDKN